MYIVVSHTPLRFTLCSLGTSSEAHILSFHIHQKFHASLGKRKSFLEHFFFFQLFTFVLKVILWDLCWNSCHTECIKWNTDIKEHVWYIVRYEVRNKNNTSNMVPSSKPKNKYTLYINCKHKDVKRFLTRCLKIYSEASSTIISSWESIYIRNRFLHLFGHGLFIVTSGQHRQLTRTHQVCKAEDIDIKFSIYCSKY